MLSVKNCLGNIMVRYNKLFNLEERKVLYKDALNNDEHILVNFPPVI